jgi:hypothetical protein
MSDQQNPTPRTAAPDAGDKPAGNPFGSPGFLGYRRDFLVNKRYQLKASLMTVTVVLILLVFLNLALYQATVRSSAAIVADAPELEEVIRAQDRVELSLILFASFVFLLGVFAVSVLETHKTAGAAYNLGRRLDEIAHGRYGTILRLRRGDNLLELEATFNEMSRTLAEVTWDEVERLNQIAVEADRLEGGKQLADALRELAADKRRKVEATPNA